MISSTRRINEQRSPRKAIGIPGCVIVHLKVLFIAMLRHSYLPLSLNLGTIILIVKDSHGDLSNPSNYRGITLLSALCKILELVLIKKCEESLDTSELQFGFKQEHSTTMCTFLVKETVNYFNARGSPVYACFLDASKAFDRVKHEDLFRILRENGLVYSNFLTCGGYENFRFSPRYCTLEIRSLDTYLQFCSIQQDPHFSLPVKRFSFCTR